MLVRDANGNEHVRRRSRRSCSCAFEQVYFFFELYALNIY